ncbi:MAG: glycerate kinase [Chloroflexi bacterium]|nr:glycerate kinase [Chloroflexota bacterium]
MKILISPQQFKESLTGSEIADSMEKGILKVWPNSTIKKIPVADGGDGTLETLVSNSNGEIKSTIADNSNFEKIKTEWGALGDKKTAVIEVARVIGLSKISVNKRNVMKASSYGIGSVFKEALDQGYRSFIVPVGGSATNDGGAGLLQALGVSLKNKSGKEIGYGGQGLQNLEKIDISGLDERMLNSNIMVACDVNNPLCGPRGASSIYGPQKGATFEQVQILDQALSKFSEIIKRDLGKDVADIPGAGASGGIGAGLMAFFSSELRLGSDIVLEILGIEKHIAESDLIIVGEGQVDRSTVFNKSPVAVSRIAKKYNKPVICIAGSLGAGFKEVHSHGIDAVFSLLNRPMSLQSAMNDTARLVEIATEQACRSISINI